MKTRWDRLPIEPIEKAAEAMTFGVEKHGDNEDTWRVDYTLDQCYAALMRHLVEWRKGNTHDRESGIHHMGHVIARAAMIMEIEKSKIDAVYKWPNP